MWAPVPLLWSPTESVPGAPRLWTYQATALSPLWAESQSFLDRHELDPPYWAFVWPGGLALASYLLANPDAVSGKRVIDFGSGSGICGLVASLLGASEVVAVDRDPLARTAIRLNAERLGLVLAVEGIAPAVGIGDVLLAGDVYYEEAPAKEFTSWFRSLAAIGATVLTGDPGRAYVPSDFRCLASMTVPASPEIESSDSVRARILTPP